MSMCLLEFSFIQVMVVKVFSYMQLLKEVHLHITEHLDFT